MTPRFFGLTGLGLLFVWLATGHPAVAAGEEEIDEYAVNKTHISDPFEGFNRAMFKVNDSLYNHLLHPVSQGYERVVPRPVRRGLANFFDNVRFPVRFVGSLLHGKGGRAARETGKFLVNTIGGLGGFIRASDDIPALTAVPAEDFGLALGSWGIKSGPYLVLPFIGPCSVRDGVGQIGDFCLTPVNWRWPRGPNREFSLAVQGTDLVSGLPKTVRTYDGFKASALDPYVALRDGYLSYREAAVKK